ncbi:hypothetical protein I7V34_14665 [Bacillus sp. V3]|nr:hypothetical protein I7V34_14665 [Bacillus sp. V3]
MEAIAYLVKEFKEGFKRGYDKNTQPQQQGPLIHDFKVNIGTFDDGTNIKWTPFVEGSRRIALIGSGEKRDKALANIERQVLQYQDVGFFKINFSEAGRLEQQGTLSLITPFEKTPVNQIPNETLAGHRQYFVELYIKYVCELLHLNFDELKVQHYPDQEGPLMGYVRAGEHLTGGSKDQFLGYINALDNILWGKENNLFEFEVQLQSDTDREFLELLKGMWSFWVFSMISFTEEHRVICVNVPTSLQDDAKEKDVNIMLGILEDIANMSNLTIILTTDSVELIKLRNIRYKCLMNNRGKDYDFTSTSLDFNDEGDAFILIDDVYKQKRVGKLI